MLTKEEQEDLLRLDDVTWYLKGFIVAHFLCREECDISYDHLKALNDIKNRIIVMANKRKD